MPMKVYVEVNGKFVNLDYRSKLGESSMSALLSIAMVPEEGWVVNLPAEWTAVAWEKDDGEVEWPLSVVPFQKKARGSRPKTI